ncbi:MAG: hypothetical protein ACRD0O_16260 [Acidimicrobiia bacterium]
MSRINDLGGMEGFGPVDPAVHPPATWPPPPTSVGWRPSKPPGRKRPDLGGRPRRRAGAPWCFPAGRRTEGWSEEQLAGLVTRAAEYTLRGEVEKNPDLGVPTLDDLLARHGDLP